MTKRIFYSILGACLFVLVVVCTVTVYAVYNGLMQEQVTSLENETRLLATALNQENDEQRSFELLGSSTVRVCLISPEGEVVYDSFHIARDEENHYNRTEIAQARENGEGFSIRHSDTQSEETYNYALRLNNGLILRLSQSHSTLLSLFYDTIWPMALIVVLLIALSAVLARTLARNIVAPINAIDPAHPLDFIPYEQLKPLLVRLDENNKKLDLQMKELENRNQNWNALISSMDEGLWMFSYNGELIYSNPAARKIFEMPDDFEVRENETLKRLFSQARHQQSSCTQMNLNGRIYSLEASQVIGKEKVYGIMILALDITEKEEAHKRRQEFSANVTHELKTPLQTISSSAELLKLGLVQQDDVPRFVGYILDETDRMSAMINDIIHLSRLENESMPTAQAVDFYEVCKKVVAENQQNAKLAGVTLNLEGEPAWVDGTIVDLESIVKNLLENAIRYNKPDGSVYLRLKRYEDMIQLKIADTGAGIPAEVQPRIFERFFTADPSRNRTGTGLGLSIVNHAVKNLDGTIEVHSKVDVGSTFIVRLPLSRTHR